MSPRVALTLLAAGLASAGAAPAFAREAADEPQVAGTLVLDRDGRMLWSGGGADAATLATIATTARRASEARGLADGSTEGSAR